MPESGDSGQNGTRIRSFNSRSNKPRSSPLSPASTSNCHSPFKQSQAERTNCGRGYSERGIIILNSSRKKNVILVPFCHELLIFASSRKDGMHQKTAMHMCLFLRRPLPEVWPKQEGGVLQAEGGVEREALSDETHDRSSDDLPNGINHAIERKDGGALASIGVESDPG